jgi:hypothetical protein
MEIRKILIIHQLSDWIPPNVLSSPNDSSFRNLFLSSCDFLSESFCFSDSFPLPARFSVRILPFSESFPLLASFSVRITLFFGLFSSPGAIFCPNPSVFRTLFLSSCDFLSESLAFQTKNLPVEDSFAKIIQESY